MASSLRIDASPHLGSSVSTPPTNRRASSNPFDLRLLDSHSHSLRSRRTRHPFGDILDGHYQAFSHDTRFPLTAFNSSNRTLSLQSRVLCITLPTDIGSEEQRSCRGNEKEVESPTGDSDTDDMANVDDRHVTGTAPSSPPELSFRDSNSSSSSFRTDSMCDESSLDKLAHFEELGLEEARDTNDFDDCNVKPESRPTLRRPTSRSSTPRQETLGNIGIDYRASNTVNVPDSSFSTPFGDASSLTLGRARKQSPLPSPAYTSSPLSARFSSRSPSPNTKPLFPQRHGSSPSLNSLVPRQSWDRQSFAGSLPNVSRRSSWQPSRKTVEELEAEYDDEDEDVPDEAILENVPITPVPGMSLVLPRRTTPSPHRRMPNPHLQGAHGSLHSAKVPRHAKRPAGPPLMPNGQYGASRSPRNGRPPMLLHSATAPPGSTDAWSFKHRSASWTQDLSEEALQLSAALGEYAELQSNDKRDSAKSFRSNGSSSPPSRPSLTKAQSTTALLELPPLQKGNVMIDPLPISKEKEAVLTRTRPSWLPPKSQKEERKHLKEWEQMMARARNAEKKRASKQRQELESHEDTKGNLARIWEQQILPNWQDSIADPTTRELWWQGVAPQVRAQVWPKAVGNELGLTAASYEAALGRATAAEDKVGDLPPEERSRSREAAWFDAIARDVPSVLPSLPIFQSNTALHGSLTDILKAYTMYRSDVGYVYGTHLIAGILSLHLRPSEAFVVLANLMNRPMPLAFLVHDTRGIARAYELVLHTLQYKIPHLHTHLTAATTNIQPNEYLDPIFRCLLAYNLPPEHVSRLWDIYVFEGDKTLVRAAVAILLKLEPKLYGSRQEILDLLSWRNETNWDVGTEDEFIAFVREAGKVDDKKEAPVLIC